MRIRDRSSRVRDGYADDGLEFRTCTPAPLTTASSTGAATSASAVIADGTVFVTAAGLSDAGVNDDIVAWAFYDAP